jgi:hypothetical protein
MYSRKWPLPLVPAAPQISFLQGISNFGCFPNAPTAPSLGPLVPGGSPVRRLTVQVYHHHL